MKGMKIAAAVAASTSSLLLSTITVADATPPAQQAGRHHADPSICNPEPPDYPGCTRAQTLPYTRVAARSQINARARGYKTYAWGQHHRGGTMSGISQPLNAHLGTLYHAAVARFHAQNGRWPVYHTWAGFKPALSALCDEHSLLHGTPFEFCGVWANQGDPVNRIMWAADKIVLGCSGIAAIFTGAKGVTDVLAGAYRGVWRAGFAFWGVTTGACIANHIPVVHDVYQGIYNWFSGLGKMSKQAAEAQYREHLREGTLAMRQAMSAR